METLKFQPMGEANFRERRSLKKTDRKLIGGKKEKMKLFDSDLKIQRKEQKLSIFA